MAKFLQQIKSKKKIFACDTFDGIPTEDQFWLSDINSDVVLNILDIVQIVNIILA